MLIKKKKKCCWTPNVDQRNLTSEPDSESEPELNI